MKRLADVAELEARLRAMAGLQCEEEGLSELDHGLQCAEVLRAMVPQDLELQLAGLLHDIACDQCHIRDHGRVGGAALRDLMGDRIAELVRLHVDAKRYLTTADPVYRAQLSRVSLATLEQQGGAMSEGEMRAYDASPFGGDAIRLREADDLAKTPGKPTLGLEFWLPYLRRSVRSAP